MLNKNLIAVLGIILLIFTACEKSSKQEIKIKQNKIKESIIYSLNASPTGIFNPTVSNTVIDGNINDVVYQSMLKFDKNLNLVSDLVSSYEISKDGKIIIFEIKSNLKWSDGENLTVDDIIFTFYSIASPSYIGPSFGNIEKVQGVAEYKAGKVSTIKGIERLDNNKIKFTLMETFAPALSKIGTELIIPKHVWEKFPVNTWRDQTEAMKNLVGSGPYKMNEFKPGQYVKLEKNENYSGEKAKTKYLILKEVNLDSIEVELKNGSVDIGDISTLKGIEIEDFKNNDFSVYSYGLNGIEYMGFNLRRDKFKDKKVRQAITYGLDREMILNRSIDGKGNIVDVAMLPSMKFFPKEGLNPYKYNVSKAEKLLKEAGWEDRDGDGTLENKKGEKFEISLKLANRQNQVSYIAPIVQNNLKNIGIKVNIEILDFSAVMEQVVGNHDFDMYLMVNMLPVDGDPKPYWHSSASTDVQGIYGWNISAFKNKRADELLEQGLRENDDDQRRVIYKEFAEILNDECPWVTFYNGNTVKAHSPNLKNFAPVTFLNMLDVEKWYVEEE